MKSLKPLFILILISSCAAIPDVSVCRSRSVSSGFCTMTISSKDSIVDDTHLLNGKTWIDLKIESVYLPADSWAKIKEYIIKQCKKDNNCAQNIGNWTSKLESVNP